ncbi:MAG: tRNA (adenosine(37)-N6)-dimethylallyltransferase MiaA [Gemmatimonadaceae bacterium]
MSSSADLEGADSPVTIPVICGPTASGKSAIASWLSQRRELLVISADSRQVYREFDVGTAKPTAEERRKVPHRGVDVVAPTERYSAADFASMAQSAIREALHTSRIPVVVGGTGFYIGALFRPLWAQPVIDPTRRQALQGLLDRLSAEELRRWCVTLDPPRAHLGRTQLLRAIEVALLTGQRLSDMHVVHARPRAFVPSYLLVDPATDLPARIAARALAMLETGWPEEVRRLMADVPPDAPAWKATGYGIVRSYVQGGLDRSDALEQLIIETRQFAKRQRTWFRHQLEAERVQRLMPNAPGWQELVDRWITEVERQQKDERVERGEHAL